MGVRHLANAILKTALPELRLLSRRCWHHDFMMLADGERTSLLSISFQTLFAMICSMTGVMKS